MCRLRSLPTPISFCHPNHSRPNSSTHLIWTTKCACLVRIRLEPRAWKWTAKRHWYQWPAVTAWATHWVPVPCPRWCIQGRIKLDQARSKKMCHEQAYQATCSKTSCQAIRRVDKITCSSAVFRIWTIQIISNSKNNWHNNSERKTSSTRTVLISKADSGRVWCSRRRGRSQSSSTQIFSRSRGFWRLRASQQIASNQ